jgi:hypothetical protein
MGLRALVILVAYLHDVYETIREIVGVVPPRRRR